jgi:hypothetical protein
MSKLSWAILLVGIFGLLLPQSASAKDKFNCYNHHNCPDDGIFKRNVTKRQCVKLKGYSWGDGPPGGNHNHNTCENLRK